MKKILYIMTTLLEVAFLAGAYIVNYFTVKKLGMVRWVNARGMRWEKNYPISMIKGSIILLLLVFTLLVLFLFIKRRIALKRISAVMVIGMIVLTALSVGYILFCSFQTMRAYYLISILFVCAAVLQIIKASVGITVCKNEE